MAKQRSLLLFENSIKSKATLKEYLKCLDRFQKIYHLKDYDSILSIEPKKLQEMIEDYVMDIKHKISPNTIPTRIYPIQSFCEVNEVEINWKKIRRLYPAKLKTSGRKAWDTAHVQMMHENCTDTRSKAILLVLASSGMRIGGLPGLKIKHLSDMDLGCKAVCVYADFIEEYFTFINSEATDALEQYFENRKTQGEILNQDSPVFRANYRLGIEKVKPITERGISELMQRLVKRAGIIRNKKGKRYDTQTNHGFRKRFNTILKTTDGMKLSLAEKMMGHSFVIPLDDAYLTPSIEQLFEEYKKALINLTVDDSARIKIEKEKLEQEKSQVNQQRIENEKLLKRIEDLEYGRDTREGDYAKSILQTKPEWQKILTELSAFVFEGGNNEEYKRKFWKELIASQKENRPMRKFVYDSNYVKRSDEEKRELREYVAKNLEELKQRKKSPENIESSGKLGSKTTQYNEEQALRYMLHECESVEI